MGGSTVVPKSKETGWYIITRVAHGEQLIMI